jgi:hypothetical protein
MSLKNLTTSLLLMFCISCGAKDSKTASVDSTKVTTNADTVANAIVEEPSESDEELNPKDDEIREMGIIKEVEDSGYPMVTLTIEFPERKFSEYFTVNLEEVKGVDANVLRKWTGKYISFLYKSEQVNALMDLRVNGKSIISDEKVELSPESKKIIGVLSGADEETPGDLPGTVSITSKDNVTLNFDFFVTASMVKANGTRVVGYYEERYNNVITAIKFIK